MSQSIEQLFRCPLAILKFLFFLPSKWDNLLYNAKERKALRCSQVQQDQQLTAEHLPLWFIKNASTKQDWSFSV